jgi:hypothetical protein
MGAPTSLWQPDQPWSSAGRILLLVALSPVLLFGLVFAGVMSVFWLVFPPRPASAQDMLDGLTDILAVRDDDSWDLDDALGNVVDRKYSDPEVEAIRLRLKQLPDFPWDQATIDEISAMRESARVLVSRREP